MPNSRSLLVAEKALWYSQTVTILMLHLDHLHLSRHCSVNVIYLGLLAVISCWPLQSSSINKLWPDNNYKTKDEPKLSSSGKKKRKKNQIIPLYYNSCCIYMLISHTKCNNYYGTKAVLLLFWVSICMLTIMMLFYDCIIIEILTKSRTLFNEEKENSYCPLDNF